MAAPPQPNDLRALVVYERSITREIRVLETKVARLEQQLNSELEKISSCSGLLEEIIAKPQGSPCASLRAELDRARAKRDRAYHKFQLQQQGGQEHDDGDKGTVMVMAAAPANPPDASAAAGGGGASN